MKELSYTIKELACLNDLTSVEEIKKAFLGIEERSWLICDLLDSIYNWAEATRRADYFWLEEQREEAAEVLGDLGDDGKTLLVQSYGELYLVNAEDDRGVCLDEDLLNAYFGKEVI